MISRKLKITAIIASVFIVLMSAAYGAFYIWNKNYKFNNNYVWQPLEDVQSTLNLKDSYNVIVAGTDPEGITAALSLLVMGCVYCWWKQEIATCWEDC